MYLYRKKGYWSVSFNTWKHVKILSLLDIREYIPSQVRYPKENKKVKLMLSFGMYKDQLPKMLKTKSDIFLLVWEQIHRISPASIPNFLWAFGLNPIEHFISILHTYIVVDDSIFSGVTSSYTSKCTIQYRNLFSQWWIIHN